MNVLNELYICIGDLVRVRSDIDCLGGSFKDTIRDLFFLKLLYAPVRDQPWNWDARFFTVAALTNKRVQVAWKACTLLCRKCESRPATMRTELHGPICDECERLLAPR
jgi:hypothetical protein